MSAADPGGFPAPRVAALLVAGGRGSRFGGAVPKQYAPLLGRPILRHSLAPFLAHPGIGHVRVVIAAADRALYEAAVVGLDLPPPVTGGASRQESVRRGLEALAAEAPDLVLVHDAARPLLDRGGIDRVLAGLMDHAGAVPTVPVSDSLLRSDDGLAGPYLDRTGVRRAQTPQGFRFPAILAAHRAAAERDYTDDVQVARAAGLAVALVAGSESNLKVTDADDLARAEAVLLARLGDLRVGHGYDVHRFGPGDRVMLGGVAIPHVAALVGHSDADVALHALTDAILGGLGDGDIGRHFPPSEPRWRGVASERFLAHAAGLVAARGGAVAHVDVTVVCESPRVGPHREAMRANIARILGIGTDRVSIKATTTERLGFAGRREGIAAYAVATVRLPL